MHTAIVTMNNIVINILTTIIINGSGRYGNLEVKSINGKE